MGIQIKFPKYFYKKNFDSFVSPSDPRTKKTVTLPNIRRKSPTNHKEDETTYNRL